MSILSALHGLKNNQRVLLPFAMYIFFKEMHVQFTIKSNQTQKMVFTAFKLEQRCPIIVGKNSQILSIQLFLNKCQITLAKKIIFQLSKEYIKNI